MSESLLNTRIMANYVDKKILSLADIAGKMRVHSVDRED